MEGSGEDDSSQRSQTSRNSRRSQRSTLPVDSPVRRTRRGEASETNLSTPIPSVSNSNNNSQTTPTFSQSQENIANMDLETNTNLNNASSSSSFANPSRHGENIDNDDDDDDNMPSTGNTNTNPFSQTPLVIGTPRTPYPRSSSQYLSSPYSQKNLNNPGTLNRGSGSNNRSLPATPVVPVHRSDVGRGLGRVMVAPAPRLPRVTTSGITRHDGPPTPSNWRESSDTGTPGGHGDDHGADNNNSFALPNDSSASDSYSASASQEINQEFLLNHQRYNNNNRNNNEDDHVDIHDGDHNNEERRRRELAQQRSSGGNELNGGEVYIWGTNIRTQESVNLFRNFLDYFILGTDCEPFYHKQFEVIHRTDNFTLNLNCQHLFQYFLANKLYKQLIDYPQDIIPIFDHAATEAYKNIFGEVQGQPDLQVRVFGLPHISAMRGLDPSHIDKLVAIKGMVIRTSSVIPEPQQAFFRCFLCAHSVEVMIEKGRIEEPGTCPSCQRKGSMQLIHNRSIYTDKQLIRMQEIAAEIPEGETPYTINLYAFHDLVDSVRPGDRIEVTGVFRAIPRRANPKHRTTGSVFKTYIDCIHIRRCDVSTEEAATASATGVTAATGTSGGDSNSNSHIGNNDVEESDGTGGMRQFTVERIQQFQEFAAGGDCYSRLVRSFAPSIWEMDDVKRGILCLLFGGTLPDARRQSKRNKRDRERVMKESRKKNKSDNNHGNGDNSISKGRKNQRVGMNSLNNNSVSSNNNNHQNSHGGDDSFTMDEDNNNNNNHDDDDDDKDDDEEDEEEEVNEHENNDHRKMRQRGDINILLCGDPGTSKSQLLSYVHKITPRGIYTSGKGSSAVGLTASVIKDPETRDMVLESGALVLSDNGICCIDEFDKMTDITRAILHEAMEQQTVSITKAGIIATLNARTSILASANPVQSRYNPRLSVVENIQLPPTLLSRFDLIYLILDSPNPDSDRRLAKHLVSLYYCNDDDDDEEEENNNNNHDDNDENEFKKGRLERKNKKKEAIINQEFLKDYIAYARYNIAPEISNEAVEVLVQGYLAMRALGGRGSKTITATPRQLESLIRISQALAKMRLSEVVLCEDVLEATRLMRVATQTAATDPRTGTIDMDMITTGKTALDRDLIFKLIEQLRILLISRSAGQRLTIGQLRQMIMKEMNNHDNNTHNNGNYNSNDGTVNVSMIEIEEAIRELETEGFLQYIPRTQTVILRSAE